MTSQAIVSEIMTWIAEDRVEEALQPVVLQPDTRLLDAGIFDSLKLLQFVGWLEDHYRIKVDVTSLTPQVFATPQSIAELVGRLTDADVSGP